MSTKTYRVVSSNVLPAGTYYIGDPCYAIRQHDVWDKMLNDTNFFNADGIYAHECSGKTHYFAAGSTAYGDGTYEDNSGNEYGVDAGMLSMIPIEMLREHGSIDYVSKLGQIVTFDLPVHVIIERGNFFFGFINIDTTCDSFENEDWDSEYGDQKNEE